MPAAPTRHVETDAPVPTWFGVGGRADALARPDTVDALREALAARDASAGPVRVLGDGANLLVDDDGADGLVVSLERMNAWRFDDGGRAVVQAGANLPKLILDACRRGLAGLEGLGGVPASVGGAVRMNAGGAFGEIGDLVESVRAIDHHGNERTLTREQLGFAYRRSNLDGLIVVEATLRLQPAEPTALRERLKEVMAYKKGSQPLADHSAGCAFKNPTVDGARTSAGRLIDEAGCKGLRVGGARVSERHANFIVADRGAAARDVIELIDLVRARVLERAGVALEQELVIWRRGQP